MAGYEFIFEDKLENRLQLVLLSLTTEDYTGIALTNSDFGTGLNTNNLKLLFPSKWGDNRVGAFLLEIRPLCVQQRACLEDEAKTDC